MTYFIEGTLLREDKPRKYMNKFFSVRYLEADIGYGKRTKEMLVTTPSKRLANWLNKMGYNLVWNDNLEIANKMCRKRKVVIGASKLFMPKEGWGDYLTRRFGETEDESILEGELRIWNELRIPTPWVYAFSSGNLEAVLFYDGNRFINNPVKTHGRKRTYGFITPIISVAKTRRTPSFL